VYANAARDTVVFEYELGISHIGDEVTNLQTGPCGAAAVRRSEAAGTTTYEWSLPASFLGKDRFQVGDQIGIGIAVNEGDADESDCGVNTGSCKGEDGQKGWSAY
jgi:hypothetical protein